MKKHGKLDKVPVPKAQKKEKKKKLYGGFTIKTILFVGPS
jgi:hypothetical protein